MQTRIETEDIMGKVITIDGPAASGKTSVSRELARRLGWHWVSTGAFYRGLGYAAHRLSLNLTDEDLLSQLSQSNQWRVEMSESKTHVYFGDEDVTEQIAKEEVGNVASKISAFPKVRAGLLASQRDCQARTEGLIAEGRDCGTVVFPDAEVKIYLTARSEDRAERRAKEQGGSTAEIMADQKQRDHQDSTRKAAPLQIPANAYVIDTSKMGFEEVVQAVENYVRNALHLKK